MYRVGNSAPSNSAAGDLDIDHLAGSGTDTITLTVKGTNYPVPIGPGDYTLLRTQAYEDIQDLASNAYNTSAISVEKLDTTPPTATVLGNTDDILEIAAGLSVALTFSEPLDDQSETRVESAITAGVLENATLTYSWADGVLTITAGSADVMFEDSVYVNIGDLYGNDVYRALLIASRDTILPQVNKAYFTYEDSEVDTIYIHFSEKVTATIDDFTEGTLDHSVGNGLAAGYEITGISGSGTNTIRLTIESTDENPITRDDSGTFTIHPGLKDLGLNSIDPSQNPIYNISYNVED
jgi:hypothetical protein